MNRYFAASALLASGWARDVLFEVSDRGIITSVTPNAQRGDSEVCSGPVVPGMPNLHSHAFQRAMAGLTQRKGPRGDDFWSWRESMYRFLERLTPDDLETIATQLYVEMLQHGYTSVAEFHYLHHDPEGKPYANRAEMGERIGAAAANTGIGLTLLPVFYAHSAFGGAEPKPEQRRFLNDIQGFHAIFDQLTQRAREAGHRIGVAPHSLRAVTAAELRALVDLMSGRDPSGPIHIHAAEQPREVEECLQGSGKRPVEWLLDEMRIDGRWCVVHATHMDDVETVRLARSGAIAGLCPTTEADLGDGFFHAASFLACGGQFGLGGDSHVGVSPFQELRLLEYGQRLRHGRRNVLARSDGSSSGGELYRAACLGGARALAQPVGRLEVNARADWIVLNTDDAVLAEHAQDTLLDAAIFGPAVSPVRDVMVAGRWCVRSGRHALHEAALQRYRDTMRRLL